MIPLSEFVSACVTCAILGWALAQYQATQALRKRFPHWFKEESR